MALEPTLTALKLCEMLFGQTFAEVPLKKSVCPRRLVQEEVDNSLSLMKLYLISLDGRALTPGSAGDAFF